MISILQNFLERNEQTSGLMILPLTTGSGKTHNVLNYIADFLTREREKKVFFITTQKKNLPVDKLKTLYEKTYKGNDFDARVLQIKSVVDCIKDNLTDKLVTEIECSNEIISNSTNFKILSAVKNEMIKYGENDACRRAEQEFRNEIVKTLKKDAFEKNESLLSLIKNDKKWNWVGKLYPMVYTSERQVYFMSMAKFLLPYDTLVEPACRLIDSEWFKDAYVFIDEFDATKETMLDRIIEDKGNNIDLISLARDMIKGLTYTEIPTVYTNNDNSRYIINKNIENLNSLCDEFSLKNIFKMSDGFKLNESFLFHDNNYWGQTTTERNLIIEPNRNLNQNIILSNSGNANSDCYKLPYLVSKIQNCLTYFQNGVTRIAQNYLNLKKDSNLKFTNSVRSFLNP